MDVLFQRAKSFASEAAKRSQDLAKEAAKISQEIAQETAKRSKELATEATKKADQLKALAGDISLPIPSPSLASSSAFSLPSTSSSADASEDEFIKYGITPELREFVNGLTLSTFQDFPVEDFNSTDSKDDMGLSNVRQDLTDWQEQHALHLLKAVPEISKFRYELCPRHMKEKRFWKIYFILVRSHIVLYEAPPVAPEDFLKDEPRAKPVITPSTPHEGIEMSKNPSKVVQTAEKKRAIDDQALDAYLLGDLDSDGDGEDVAYDAEFDPALDSDADEDEKGATKNASSSQTTGSDDSLDGELI